MTAEIAILNRSAVAIAADSAVTIENQNSAKVYNTVNKLFTLSKFHPVGIMVHGSADYMGIPWETIIKMYREHVGPKQLSSVQAYGRDFIKYLHSAFKFSVDDERRHVQKIWTLYFENLNTEVRNALLSLAKSKKLNDRIAAEVFQSILEPQVERLRKVKLLTQYRGQSTERVLRRYRNEFLEAKKSFAGRQFNATILGLLHEYARLILVKSEFQHGVSGIVITGFGKKEIFPAIFTVKIAGCVLGKCKIEVEKYRSVSADPKYGVFVRAFAQSEMVVRFMEGADPRLTAFIEIGVKDLADKIADELLEKYSKGTSQQKTQRKASARSVVSNMINGFMAAVREKQKQDFVRPVLEVLSVLPKEDLAELAGALVNLTSLKRRVTMGTETVGGPVDVAVISKGDGFIWIRRKHYFKTDLNPTFLTRYLSANA